MDPVTAFQTAAAVLQFTGILYSVATTTYDIYKSPNGLSKQSNALLEEASNIAPAAKSVEEGLASINSCGRRLDRDEKRLETAAQQCVKLSSSLLNEIGRLKLGARHRMPLAAKLSVLSVIRASKLRGMKEQLVALQQELQTELLINIWRKVDVELVDHSKLLECLNSVSLQATQQHAVSDSQLTQIISDIQRTQSENLAGHQKTHRLIEQVIAPPVEQQHREQFLKDLSFEYVISRQQLKSAYPDTCEWIWKASQQSDSSSSCSNFLEWLEIEAGIYWIEGKAGSGKSTLMNYISQHEELHARLSIWTNGQRCIVPTFFFWRLGSPEQKSIEGLLRSLLLQILKKGSPHLMEHLTPFTRFLDENLKYDSAQRHVHWPVTSLLEMLWTLIDLQDVNDFYCFLIDGIDEFEGEPEDQQRLVEFLMTLSPKPRVKLCLSSRPEKHLVPAFSGSAQLRLQDFNEKDIYDYVNGTLRKEPRMKDLMAVDPGSTHDLIYLLSNKAEGVFLWACFAVGEALKGLWAMESLQAVKRRIERLSPSLQGIFRQMLSGLEEGHLDELAQTVGLVLRWDDLCLENYYGGGPPLLFSALFLGADRFSNLSAALTERDPVRLARVASAWLGHLSTFSRAVRARACGFLDVSVDRPLEHKHTDQRSEFDDLFAEPLNYTDSSLQLVHRSLGEFLAEDDDAIRMLGGRMLPLEDLEITLFAVNGAMLCIFLRMCVSCVENTIALNTKDSLASKRIVENKLREISRYLHNCTLILKKAQSANRISEKLWSAVDLLDKNISELDVSPVRSWRIRPYVYSQFAIWDTMSHTEFAPASMFTIYACSAGLYKVALRMLPSFPVTQWRTYATIAMGALVETFWIELGSKTFRRTVASLLVLGADCNRPVSKCGGNTPWERILTRSIEGCLSTSAEWHQTFVTEIIPAIALFVNAGANLDAVAVCEIYAGRGTDICCDTPARFLLDRLVPLMQGRNSSQDLPDDHLFDEVLVCKFRSVMGGVDAPKLINPTLIDWNEHIEFTNILLSSAETMASEKPLLQDFANRMARKDPQEIGSDPEDDVSDQQT